MQGYIYLTLSPRGGLLHISLLLSCPQKPSPVAVWGVVASIVTLPPALIVAPHSMAACPVIVYCRERDSYTTGLRENTWYQIGYRHDQISARNNINSSGAETEKRIDSRVDDATMARVEQHANTCCAPLSPSGPLLPDHCEPFSGQSDTPLLDVCIPCPPQTDCDCSQIYFCGGPLKEGIINTYLVRCQGNGKQYNIKSKKPCLKEFGWWGRDNNKGPGVFCLQCMTKDDPLQETCRPDVPWDELEH